MTYRVRADYSYFRCSIERRAFHSRWRAKLFVWLWLRKHPYAQCHIEDGGKLKPYGERWKMKLCGCSTLTYEQSILPSRIEVIPYSLHLERLKADPAKFRHIPICKDSENTKE